MKRVPILPTLLVLVAVLTMIGLGIWQLQRRAEKDLLVSQASANLGKALIPLPPAPTDATLFRRVTTVCQRTGAWRVEAGRASDGTSGYRHIVECYPDRTPTAVLVEMGVATDPRIAPRFPGGRVVGTLVKAPGGNSLLDRMRGAGSDQFMIVAERPASGLKPSRRPDPATLPNNHLAYALQWFFFAMGGIVIYVLALRRRSR